jgi:hypothetical protein
LTTIWWLSVFLYQLQMLLQPSSTLQLNGKQRYFERRWVLKVIAFIVHWLSTSGNHTTTPSDG